jgi:hypothetical protein
VAHDLGAVDGRRRLRNQEIMKLRSGITPARQDRLILKVDPVDSLSIGKRMAAILSTLLSIGSEAGASNNEGALIQALRQGSSQGFSQVGEPVVGPSLNVQPTITIQPGFPVRIIVNRDLVLEPTRAEGANDGET